MTEISSCSSAQHLWAGVWERLSCGQLRERGPRGLHCIWKYRFWFLPKGKGEEDSRKRVKMMADS